MVIIKYPVQRKLNYVIMMNPILEGSCQKLIFHESVPCGGKLARLPIERVRKGESAARLAPS